jgi:hypothetical protein
MGIAKVIENYRTWGHKEFMRKFKSGIEGITPLQQAKMIQRSTWISFLGVLLGIGVTLWQWKNMWWVLIILLGGAGITIVQLIGGYQKVKILENISKLTQEIQ